MFNHLTSDRQADSFPALSPWINIKTGRHLITVRLFFHRPLPRLKPSGIPQFMENNAVGLIHMHFRSAHDDQSLFHIRIEKSHRIGLMVQ